jgi:antitoxin (DNA-binding transcriptional repressor) of toxin-antitoxin stability system
MQVTVHAAQSSLSKLIEAVLLGEEVIIAQGEQPVVKLVPLQRSGFKFDLLKGQLAEPPSDFFEPLAENQLAQWEGDQ